MTKRQVQRLVERYWAGRFPDLHPIGDLLVVRNGPLLRGFIFDRSQMNKFIFRLHAFALVLSIPTEGIRLGLSRELGDFSIEDGEETAFTAAAQKAEAQGRPYLAMVSDLESLLANFELARKPWASSDFLMNEGRAHCLIWLGRDDEGRRQLAETARGLDPSDADLNRRFLMRIRMLEERLESSHEAARTLLEDWAAQTTVSIGLARLPDTG